MCIVRMYIYVWCVYGDSIYVSLYDKILLGEVVRAGDDGVVVARVVVAAAALAVERDRG